MGFSAFFIDLIFLEETYPPVILISKAAELRRRTKNWGIHAKQEEIEIDFRELVTKNFSRPMRLLTTEPIVLLISIYTAFIYGLLYLFLTAYPIVFQQIHGMSAGVGGLPYFGMIIGMLSAGLYIVLTQPSYNKKLAANNGVPVPEWRLPPMVRKLPSSCCTSSCVSAKRLRTHVRGVISVSQPVKCITSKSARKLTQTTDRRRSLLRWRSLLVRL